MNHQARIPRSRGGICGVLLILLGLWGGVAPFVGPYFHFGFGPDKAWAYNSGRLYYSIIPGAVALAGGLLVLITRYRVVGIVGAVLGVLAGAWFALGEGLVTVVLRRPSIVIGQPIPPAGVSSMGPGSLRMYLESITLFGGLGLLILLCAALAAGRFSLVAASDIAAEGEDGGGYYASVTSVSPPSQLTSATDPFRTSADQFPASQAQDTTASPFPPSTGST